jgi:uncharacterized protein YggE
MDQKEINTRRRKTILRELRVQGVGKTSITPDQMIIDFEILSDSRTYETTMMGAKHKYDSLKQALVDNGFSEGDLKTVSFYLERRFAQVKETDGTYKDVFKGFRHHHSLRLEFPFDIERLGLVLNILLSGAAEPNFNVQFGVADKSQLMKDLLGKAVIDARQKALILAQAGGVRLGDIMSMEYDHNEVVLLSPTRYGVAEASMAFGGAEMNITPQDIQATERVNIVWEIL